MGYLYVLLGFAILMVLFGWIDKRRENIIVDKKNEHNCNEIAAVSKHVDRKTDCGGFDSNKEKELPLTTEEQELKVPLEGNHSSEDPLAGGGKIKKSMGLLLIVLILLFLPVPKNIFVSLDQQSSVGTSLILYSQADRYINTTFVQAFGLWAAGRVMNKAISMGQDVPIAGQVLDPLNDTVERVCTFLTFAMLALGGFKFLLLLGPLSSLKILLPLGIIFRLCSLWTMKLRSKFRHYSNSLILLGVSLFLLPTVLVWLNIQVATSYVDPQLNRAIDLVVGVAESVPTSQVEANSTDSSWLENIFPSEVLDSVSEVVSSATGIANMLVSSDFYRAVIGASLGLFLKCMLMPLLTFYILVVVVRFMMHEVSGCSLEINFNNLKKLMT